MNPLSRLARPVPLAVMALMIAVVAALGFAVFDAVNLSAQGQSTPGAPTNVRPAGAGAETKYGNNEMRLAWSAPAAGSCAATLYYVRVYKKSDGSIVEQGDTPNTYYVATHLQPSTSYTANVWSYGSTCNEYSDLPGHFAAASSLDRTNSTNNSNDPAPPANQGKAASNPPGTVTMSKNGSSATLSWTAPTADATRCAHTDYSYRLNNHTTHDNDDDIDGITTSSSQTFTGLTTGTKYYFELWSYSTHPCDLHSPTSDIFWTH